MLSLKEFKEFKLDNSDGSKEIKGGVSVYVVETAYETDNYINSGGQHITTYVDGMNMGTDSDGY